MKTVAVMVAAVMTLAIIGCGPSAEQKKMMADLTSEVKNMMSSTSAKLGEFDNVAGQIATAVAGADSLAMKFPKDTASIMGAVNQLKGAKDRLMSVKENVSQWMSSYKEPDMAKMKFDEIISSMKKSKDDLTSAGTEIEGALNAATTALGSYKDLAANLMSKMAMKKR